MSVRISGYNMVKIIVKRGNLSGLAPMTIGLMLDAVRESLGSPVFSLGQYNACPRFLLSFDDVTSCRTH